MSPALLTSDPRVAALPQAVQKAANHLLSQQYPDGFWWAELTADTTLESDYILLQLWMHPPKDGVWNPPTRDLVGKAVQSILDRQLPDGGFNVYQKGPSDISATVKAYFALKIGGLSPDDPRLSRARERILALGGIQAANSYVKINLSLFDLYPRPTASTSPSCFCRIFRWDSAEAKRRSAGGTRSCCWTRA
jgi:squalene-hopene/tetraprenyl-beta-curcumene cyclase